MTEADERKWRIDHKVGLGIMFAILGSFVSGGAGYLTMQTDIERLNRRTEAIGQMREQMAGMRVEIRTLTAAVERLVRLQDEDRKQRLGPPGAP